MSNSSIRPVFVIVTCMALYNRHTEHTIFAGCREECNKGDMKCYGIGLTANQCCNFYDPTNGQCLDECPSDKKVADNFDCVGKGFTTNLLINAK